MSPFPHCLIMAILRKITAGYVFGVCIPRSPVALDIIEIGPGEDFMENYRERLHPVTHLG